MSLNYDFFPPERSRTYLYESGVELTLEDVERLHVSENGTHYLDCADGGKYIVRCGWIAIVLDVDEWTAPDEV